MARHLFSSTGKPKAQLRITHDKRQTWDYMRDWLRARVEGTKLARADNPTSAVKVFSGFEFTAVRSQTGAPCGSAPPDPVHTNPLINRCAIDYLGPQVEFDYYGYSAWQTVNEKFDNPAVNLKQTLNRDLTFALNLVKAARPEISERNFMILEYGFERPRYGECASANFTDEMFAALEGPGAFPLSYAVWWQVIDNAPGYYVGDTYFGFYRTQGAALQLTLPGTVFQKRLAGQSVVPYTGCPLMRHWPPTPGILNAATHDGNFQLNPDSVMEIYTKDCCANPTAPFSSAGNTVHFDQTARKFALPRDNARDFFESPTQINAGLPLGRRPGEARAWLTDARGIDSNNETILVTCADCPRISPSCGVVDSNYQTLQIEPGGVVTIHGERFSPTNNTVVVEQRNANQETSRAEVTRPRIVSESPTEIVFLLPTSFVPAESIVHVVDAEGRESGDVGFPISGACEDCAPRLRPCGALTNEAGDAGGAFQAGATVVVAGHFALTDNKIILEQTDTDLRVYRYVIASGSSGFEANNKRIKFTLPTSLFAGRALLYVIDAQSRESRARELQIAAASVTSVSAANYRGPQLAAGSIATAFGNALATATLGATGQPLPLDLAGTRLTVRDSAGVDRTASLFFVSPTQVNFQLPPGAATGNAVLTFTSGFGATSTSNIEILRVAPGLFSAAANGKGLAAAVLLRVKAGGQQNYEAIAAFNSAQSQFAPVPIDFGAPDDQLFLILFGTGVRGASSLAAVTARLGGTAAEVTYAGTQGTLTGVDQINIRLPRGLAGRGDVDVVVTVEGLVANTVKVNFK